ncbi:heparin-sulfate lyase HepC [Lysobacter enzymogenes]|uniref:Heparinase n=1 Tax=Lysobacter enzymogenes TaxID=69 RepID=A0A3N2RI76_LYSEN|nr:heparin-sulfate lyase HepC [Lysobacter enzymogenes]ROU07089.1 heparinase [Lysobacter enzymogenes]
MIALRGVRSIALAAAAACALVAANASAQTRDAGRDTLALLDLDRPGLEQVKRNVDAGKHDAAAAALLDYYRRRHAGKAPDYSNAEEAVDAAKKPGKAIVETANNALLHRFQPHKGYGFFDYGADIDWQYWPVKDNEVRWQLHRVKWWDAMGRVYRDTHDERYAKEWMAQFSDWARKNPPDGPTHPYAWRALEVSERVNSLVTTFGLFVDSPSITPAFLLEFLASYHQQADYLPAHYAKEGNHRLFEAQRLLYAGASFPEFKRAGAWRKSGVEVLNQEIGKQVYADGIQYELSPSYHLASIDIFLNAYATAKKAGIENEFPASYRQAVENMANAYFDFSFPDLNAPMFGDSWIGDRSSYVKRFKGWLSAFPDNPAIRYYASEGKQGHPPAHLSKGLTVGGFYTFRSGWTPDSTILILKASPPGEFHAQPDNGTFELWVNGRNFMPDSGVYVYSGDAEIQKMRNWYRQSRVHNTLTLDDADMQITKAALAKWQPDGDVQVLAYANPSYPGLDHQRTVLFVDQTYFVIVDRAVGTATGKLGTHFVLREDSNPAFDERGNRVHTRYADGNNLLVQNLDDDATVLREEQGKVSYLYRKETARPAFVFEKPKTDAAPRTFVSVLFPYRGATPPSIRMKRNAGNDFERGRLDLTLVVDGKEKRLRALTRQDDKDVRAAGAGPGAGATFEPATAAGTRQ